MFPAMNISSNNGLIISSGVYGKKYDKIVNASKLISRVNLRKTFSLDFPEPHYTFK